MTLVALTWFTGARALAKVPVMHIFYLDEFGNADVSAKSIAAHPWSVLSAVVIEDTARLSLANDLMAVKDRFFSGWRSRPWRESEIKGRYLKRAEALARAGKPIQKPAGYAGMDLAAVDALTRAVGLVFAKFRPTIYAVAVDKTSFGKYKTPWDPVAIGYVYLQQRATFLVEDVHGSDEGVLFVADEQKGHERLFADGTMESVRRQLSARMQRQADFKLIFDKPLWANKLELPADREIIQLADITAYLVGSAAKSGNWKDDWLQKWVLPNAARHWRRGEVWNAGITLLPTPAAFPVLTGP